MPDAPPPAATAGDRTADRLQGQLRRVLDGEAWDGPPLRLALAGLPDAAWDARPIPGAHTIHELVLHLAVWLDAAARRAGGDVGDVPDADDFPPPGAPADAHDRLDAAAARLDAVLAALDPSALDAPTPGRYWTAYETAQGTVEHVAYHTGQIVLLRRALGLAPPTGYVAVVP